MKVTANGVSIEVEDTGDASRPVVLLIMGLGMQLVAWPQPFIDALVNAGYRVVTMDNRDIGLSQKFDSLGVPNIPWTALKLKIGLPVRPPYSLTDMAADAIGVLDALGIARAHVVGVSMGGMIAQRVAIAAPDRVISLTSIMSTSGARGLPEARPEVVRVLLGRPANSSNEAVINHYIKLFRAIGSPGFPMSDEQIRDRVSVAVKRGVHPKGVARQLVATASDSARAAALAGVRSPTLVVHGKADPLVPFPAGEDTARRIPGARLVGVDGMGHDLPPPVVERLLTEIIPHINAAQGAAAT